MKGTPVSVYQRTALSEKTQELFQEISDLKIPNLKVSASGQRPLNEQLFDARAEAKILTSTTIAMYTENKWRSGLFRQLDSLLDIDEWEEEDVPLSPHSFRTFLKAIMALGLPERPGLGLTPSGNLIAAWTQGEDYLTIEFLSDNMVRWVVSCYLSKYQIVERTAGQTLADRLPEALAPHFPDKWFKSCPQQE